MSTYRPFHRTADRCTVAATPAGGGWWWIRCLTCDTTALLPSDEHRTSPYQERSTT